MSYIGHPRETFVAVIASGGTDSTVVNLGPYKLVALEMPTGWDAASLSFLATLDGTNFYAVEKTDGSLYSVTVEASKWYVFDLNEATLLAGLQSFKLKASAAQSGGERTFKLIGIMSR